MEQAAGATAREGNVPEDGVDSREDDASVGWGYGRVPLAVVRSLGDCLAHAVRIGPEYQSRCWVER